MSTEPRDVILSHISLPITPSRTHISLGPLAVAYYRWLMPQVPPAQPQITSSGAVSGRGSQAPTSLWAGSTPSGRSSAAWCISCSRGRPPLLTALGLPW